MIVLYNPAGKNFMYHGKHLSYHWYFLTKTPDIFFNSVEFTLYYDSANHRIQSYYYPD